MNLPFECDFVYTNDYSQRRCGHLKRKYENCGRAIKNKACPLMKELRTPTPEAHR